MRNDENLNGFGKITGAKVIRFFRFTKNNGVKYDGVRNMCNKETLIITRIR